MALQRPRVTWKTATSLDGRIALGNGESQWITGPQARRVVHEMRAAHDAVLTGIGTVLADDPEMTARGVGAARQPLRCIMDTRGRTPVDCAMVRSAGEGPVLILTGEGRETPAYRDGVEVEALPMRGGWVVPEAALAALAARGVASVMLECGGRLAASFLTAGLVDRIEWFRAPVVIGGDGQGALRPLGLIALADAPRMRLEHARAVGEDQHETYVRRLNEGA